MSREEERPRCARPSSFAALVAERTGVPLCDIPVLAVAEGETLPGSIIARSGADGGYETYVTTWSCPDRVDEDGTEIWDARPDYPVAHCSGGCRLKKIVEGLTEAFDHRGHPPFAGPDIDIPSWGQYSIIRSDNAVYRVRSKVRTEGFVRPVIARDMWTGAIIARSKYFVSPLMTRAKALAAYAGGEVERRVDLGGAPSDDSATECDGGWCLVAAPHL